MGNTFRISTVPPLALAFGTLLGCAAAPLQPEVVPLANHATPGIAGPESCGGAMAMAAEKVGPALDPSEIDMLVWNIQKGADPTSLSDLERLANDKHLVLIQEARLEQRPADALDNARFWSFAPGYRTANASTGVMTLSETMPLVHCRLAAREPWLRSPKATSITEFGLQSTELTLAVVNVHAVNFTLGVADFSQQLAKIEAALMAHDGPVILAGDFNTWRPRRLEILHALADRLRLSELTFDVDKRVTPIGGNIVDRIFVRDLYAVEASTVVVESSDHNPMSVRLSM
ncbi:MAG: endonuclease/exonuclease/phosphatase family protein [Gammaproteobacteria bacterium]